MNITHADPPVSVGGQAVVEGVMMRTPAATSVAVRRSDGSLVVRVRTARRLVERYPFLAAPGFRGVAVLIETLSDGISALNFAASQAIQEEEGADRSAPTTLALVVTLTLSMGFGYLLFAVVPHVVTILMGDLLGVSALSGGRAVVFHLVDGLVKVAVFVAFLWAISRMRDIHRVFQYHGAEHQAVHAYESGLNLLPTSLSRFPTEHPRCGTSFLVSVIVVSILVFTAVFPWMPDLSERRWANQILYMAIKAPLILPIAALSYELIRLSSRTRNRLLGLILSAPGVLFQRITTKRPNPDQQEVAIVALIAALHPERLLRATGQNEAIETFPSFEDFQRGLPMEA